jgi:two-component system sensor kinase FixL
MRTAAPAISNSLVLAAVSFALLLLLVAAGGWLTWRNIERIGEDNDQVIHTYAVMQASSEILRALRNVESNARLYALTGHEDSLRAVNRGQAEIDAGLDELARLTDGAPDERLRLQRLRDSIAAWIAQVESSLRSVPVTGSLSGALRARLVEDKQNIDAVRAQVLAFDSLERGQLAARAQAAERASTMAWVTIGVATGAALVLLVLAAYGVRRELVQRRSVERALEHSEARYRMLIENLPNAVFVHQAGRIVFANEALTTLLGAASADEVLGKSPLEFAAPASIAAIQEAPRNAGDAGTRAATGAREETWRRRDASPITCAVSAEQIDWQGAPAVLVAVSDLTRRVRAEAARRESEAQLAAIVGSAMDAIISVDEDQRIVLFNAAAEAMFGLPAAEAPGQPFTRLIAERSRARHEMLIRRPVEAGMAARRVSTADGLFGRRASGEEFPIEATISRSEAGGKRLHTVIVRDITERVRREEQLRVTENQLAHMGRLSTLGEMTAGISHEINQPLTAIATYAQVLERYLAGDGDIDRPELADVARQVAAQALRAGEVIRRLRAMVKNEAPRLDRLYCGELLEDVRTLAEVDARIHQVRLDVEAEDPRLAIRGNAVQLQQVLINLVRNAIDALDGTPELDRRIELRQRSLGAHARFEVVDHGPGVPPASADELFRPFFTTKSHGTGLGLAISRSIMAAHGGRLEHQPTPGGGATFTVTLPVAASEAA